MCVCVRVYICIYIVLKYSISGVVLSVYTSTNNFLPFPIEEEYKPKNPYSSRYISLLPLVPTHLHISK